MSPLDVQMSGTSPGIDGDVRNEIMGRSVCSEGVSDSLASNRVPHAYDVEASQPKPQEPTMPECVSSFPSPVRQGRRRWK